MCHARNTILLQEDCRRILNISFGSQPSEDIIIAPSAFPCHSHKRPQATASKEIVSLVLTNLPRPHPFALHKGAHALNAAYDLVKAVLHEPLRRGRETGHYIVPTALHEVAASIGKRKREADDSPTATTGSSGATDSSDGDAPIERSAKRVARYAADAVQEPEIAAKLQAAAVEAAADAASAPAT
jgi:hypothetical protein